jgi:hypothetical protein
MSFLFTYRSRPITLEDIVFIRRLIDDHPDYGRCKLSKEICRNWNWRQANGQLKDMICRGLLLRLEKEGYLILPSRKFSPQNPFLNRKAPEHVEIRKDPIKTSLQQLGPINIEQVRRSPHEKLFNGLIAQYHYLGYSQPVGEHLKYIAFSQGRPLACFAWSSAAWHIRCRDSFIGWEPDVRKKNLHLLAYNNRFLVLPWVHVKNFASHILSKCTKVLSSDWQRIYHHSIYWAETFVDRERFEGTCYRAANWILLGKTTGRGKNDQTHRVNRSIKDVYGYPLVLNFKKRLGVAQ